jgi:hypothetical protein
MENITSPLFLDGWAEFNKYKWGLTPKRERVRSTSNKEAFIDYVIYLDRKNKIRMPKLNNYLPMHFFPTQEGKLLTQRNQWLSASEELVKKFSDYGLANAICFTPNIFDVRMFQWYGYVVEPRYTYYIDFPLDVLQVSSEVRRRIAKCTKNNFIFEKTNNLSDVFHCIVDTAKRKNLNFYLTLDDLKVVAQLIGEEHFRTYVSYTPQGRPASASIMLHYPGCRTFYWIAGTVKEQLDTGVSQFTLRNTFEDLHKAGSTGVDFGAATSAELDHYKNDWGGQLVSYYMVMEPGLRSIGYQIYRKIFSSKKIDESSFIYRMKYKLKIAIDHTVVKKII